MKRTMVLAAATVLLVVSRAGAETPGEALTRGKLEADQGRPKAAAAAFAAILGEQGASVEQRWEALIRLGVARREAGDTKGSVDAFEEAWRKYGKDPAALRFLLEAVGSALPGRERWEEIASKVTLEFDRTVPAKPQVRVVWPGVTSSLCPCLGKPTMSLDFKESDLLDVFRLFADVSGENIVVSPGIKGKITFRVSDMPWDEALDRVLAPNGLIARHVGNLVWISRPEDASEKSAFNGERAGFDFRNVDLIQVLREVAARGGCTVEVAEGVGGRVYIRLADVPWDQAFDVIAGTNHLAWTRTGNVIRVTRRPHAEGDRPVIRRPDATPRP